LGQASPEVADHVGSCEACRAAMAGLTETLVGPPPKAPEHVPPTVPPTLPPTPRQPGGFEPGQAPWRGGMGAGWLAYHPLMKCLCAIKMLRDDQYGDALTRFQREIELFSRLDHPNVVGIRHAEVIEGRTVLVMKYVEGSTLQQIGQKHKKLAIADAC